MNTTSFLNQNTVSTYDTTLPSAGIPGLSCQPVRGLRGLFRRWFLKQRRVAQTYESFACFFAGQGIPEPILQETYRVLARNPFPFSSFPVDPLDPLRAVYGLDCYRGDTLSVLMNEIRRASDLDFYRPVPAFLPCDTVSDLVYLLAARCDAVYPATAPGLPSPDSAEAPISEAR